MNEPSTTFSKENNLRSNLESITTELQVVFTLMQEQGSLGLVGRRRTHTPMLLFISLKLLILLFTIFVGLDYIII